MCTGSHVGCDRVFKTSSRAILAWSNLLGLPAVFIQCANANFLSAFVIACAMTASILMHLSEHKSHKTAPPTRFLARWSSLLLHIDRAVAWIMFLHFVHCCSDWPTRNIVCSLVIFLFGLVFWAIAECFSANLRVYFAAHMAWHVAIYLALFQIAITARTPQLATQLPPGTHTCTTNATAVDSQLGIDAGRADDDVAVNVPLQHLPGDRRDDAHSHSERFRSHQQSTAPIRRTRMHSAFRLAHRAALDLSRLL